MFSFVGCFGSAILALFIFDCCARSADFCLAKSLAELLMFSRCDLPGFGLKLEMCLWGKVCKKDPLFRLCMVGVGLKAMEYDTFGLIGAVREGVP